MKTRVLGKSGIEASVVALGTWPIGGGKWWGKTEDEESIRAIRTAVDNGISLIDTAPIYGWGRSEEVVGRAIKDIRDKVVIATKCGLWWKDDRGSKMFELEGNTVRRSLRPDTINIEIDESLKRLGVDCIDLYQTHWQAMEPEKTPIADTMECLLKLRDQGKIRAIGVSNATIDDMEEYRKVGRIDSNQPRYSMLDRDIEKRLVPYCIENNISILAYSPLEQGLLAGKITMDTEFSEGEYRNNLPWLQKPNRKRVLEVLDGWEDLLEKYSCTIAQLVIAWTFSQPGITHVLCGARKTKHAEQNAEAGDMDLESADIQRMRSDVEALGEPVKA